MRIHWGDGLRGGVQWRWAEGWGGGNGAMGRGMGERRRRVGGRGDSELPVNNDIWQLLSSVCVIHVHKE